MKKENLKKIRTISEFHQLMDVPRPEHPLISVVNFEEIALQGDGAFVFEFYAIAIKEGFDGKMRYGQHDYDFDEGMMSFVAPNQVFSFEGGRQGSVLGTLILFHPDFLWSTSLATNISKFDFFSYAIHEALFLSDREKKLILGIAEIIEQEYQSNIDDFSQEIIITQLELLLKYADRFYQRQFITRKKAHHAVLDQLETVLNQYFASQDLASKGIPSIQYIADELHMSSNYLSRLLTNLTGQSTKKFVHDKLIAVAKEKLSTTDLSVNEIAYSLGFEHPQSFSKLFKSQTQLTPLAFRQSFN